MTFVAAILLLVAGFTEPVRAADWTEPYDLAEDADQACRVVVGSDGYIYVLSTSVNDDGDDAATVWKVSATDGSVQYTWEYAPSADTALEALDLAVNGSGSQFRVYVAVRLDLSNSHIPKIAAFKSNQTTPDWVNVFRGDVSGARLVGIAAKGTSALPGVAAAGCAYVAGSDTDYVLAAYTWQGGTSWTANFDGHGSGGSTQGINYNDWATAVACDASGNVWVTGKANRASQTPNDYEICTIRWSSDGVPASPLWENPAEADEDDEMEDCGVDVDVRQSYYAYVTGRFMNYPNENQEWDENYDVRTICYNASTLQKCGHKDYGDNWHNEEPIELAIAGSDQAVVLMRSADDDFVSAVTARYYYSGALKESWARSVFLGDEADQGPVGVAAAGSGVTMSAITADLDPAESGDDDFLVSLFEPTGFQRKTWVYNPGDEVSQRAADVAVFRSAQDSFVVTVGTTGDADESDVVVMRRDCPNGWIWAEAGGVTHHPMPAAPSGKAVKDGGWLEYNATNELVYAAKGYKTDDFYAYDPAGDSWTGQGEWPSLTPIPPGTEGKLPSKGCAACVDPSGYVYMTKGNSTLGFWQYDIANDEWHQKTNVPLGLSNKKVKGGTDMA